MGVCVIAALAAAGCGDDEGSSTGSPASLVPAEALLYAEGVVRPEGDQREAIEAIAARFPGGEDLGELIVADLDESFAEGEGEATPTWEDDIEPWLGERAGVALTGLEPDPDTGEAPFILILDTTDGEAAQAALPDFIEVDGSEPTEREAGDLTYFVDEEGAAGGVVDESLVLASTEDDFLAVTDVASGEADALADSEDFSYDVAGTDGADALAYATLEPRPLIDAAIAADPSAEFSREQLDRVLESTGTDLDEPFRFALNADSDSVAFESSAGGSDALAEGRDAALELLGSLPADSTFAAVCQGCLEGFGAGFAIGVAEAAAEDGATPEQAEQALRERLGLDVDALLDALGPAVVFARGESLFDISGAAVIGVSDPDEVARALDGVAAIIRSEAAADAEVSGLPSGLPADAEGFSVALTGAPVAINAVLSGDRLVIAFGEEATLDALEAPETLADSGRLDEAAERLGEGYEPLALADLDSLFGLIGSIPNAEASEAEPYLEPFADVAAGDRVEGDRYEARAIVGFD